MRVKTLVPISLAVVMLFFAYRAIRSDTQSITITSRPVLETQNSELVVPSEKLDFGTVWAKTDFEWILPITNCGAEPLDITDFLQSCTCTAVEPQRLTIQPGATENLKIRVDLLTKYKDRTAFQITAKTRGPNGEIKTHRPWTISGRVNKLFSVVRPLQFQSYSVLSQPIQPVECTVSTALALDSLQVETDDRRFAAQAERISDTDQYRIRLTALGKLECGRLDQTVTLIPKKAGDSLPSAKLRCTGSIERDVELAPASVLSGTHQLG